MLDRHEIIIGALKCGLKRAHELVALTQTSHRTIYRDIAALKRAGHPIRGEAGVGYVLRGEKERRAA